MSESTMTGYGRHWREIAAEMESAGQLTVLADRLCEAESAQESIDAVMDRAARRFQHSILFQVRDAVATVWAARGWARGETLTDLLATSAVSGNPLELLMIHETFHGAVPLEQAYVPFFEQLGLSYPREISLTPVEVRGRIVGILYGDNGETDRLSEDENGDAALARALALGLTLVLIKTKIRNNAS